nr:ATP-binding cassette domain-containing protein [Neptunicella marina]
MHLQQSELSLPQSVGEQHAFAVGSSLVKLTQAKVQFSDKVIFDQLDWHIIAGQHWQIHGPNGSGKSCLLNLISGDNPQCYRNQIELFGITRGQGESIWQIKQHIGYLTNQFHRDYRVNCKVLDCIISGFYDSIGLYQTATFAQQKIAREWLNVIGLASLANKGFRELETGEQRMVLIARAMVKHPPLLILDEPCQGLDSINRQKVLALVELLCQQNTTTLLYVSHHGEDKISAIEHHLSMPDYHP